MLFNLKLSNGYNHHKFNHVALTRVYLCLYHQTITLRFVDAVAHNTMISTYSLNATAPVAYKTSSEYSPLPPVWELPKTIEEFLYNSKHWKTYKTVIGVKVRLNQHNLEQVEAFMDGLSIPPDEGRIVEHMYPCGEDTSANCAGNVGVMPSRESIMESAIMYKSLNQDAQDRLKEFFGADPVLRILLRDKLRMGPLLPPVALVSVPHAHDWRILSKKGGTAAPAPESTEETYANKASRLTAKLPDLKNLVGCPACDADEVVLNHNGSVVDKCKSENVNVESRIMYLNDHHKWTREQIADWLDVLSAEKGWDFNLMKPPTTEETNEGA